MNFNSYIFILAFFPIVFVLYHLLKKIHINLGKIVLCLASGYFIYYVDAKHLIFFAASIIVNFALAKLIQKDIAKKLLLALGVILNVLSLGVFKYTGFQNIFIPLGISFVSFTQIAFLVDCYKGKIEKLNLLDYVTFTLYFPKLVQGPICKYNEVINQIEAKKSKVEVSKQMAVGLWFFAIGFGKKVLLADNLANIVAVGFDFDGDVYNRTSLEAMISMLCYTLQIYFDFGGYSHMALGVSSLLGITLKDNFDRPYIAVSVDDFWKRWHISLTDFLREYIYFSLGGSRKGAVRAYLNVMAIFLISGVWHGDTLNFLVWGAIHGVAMCINRFIDRHTKIKPNIITNAIGWIITFVYVNITWVFFRAGNIKQSISLIKTAFFGGTYSISQDMIDSFKTNDLEFFENKIQAGIDLIEKVPNINIYIVLITCMLFALLQKERTKDFKPTIIKSIWAMFILLWSIISLSNVAVFIYGAF